MDFIQSTYDDIEVILELYDLAEKFQQTQGMVNWQGFERSLVVSTIDKGFQWHIEMNGEIACVFSLAVSDPLIWGEKDNDPAVYIHRIATNPRFRGNNFVKHIIEFVSAYAIKHNKQFVRLDTLSGNENLHNHYLRSGLSYLGDVRLKDPAGLPAHYSDGMFSLFEIKVNVLEK